MKLIIVIFVFFCSLLLFSKAAGSLNLKKLNIISFVFYNMIIFSYIGASCVFLGFRDHYLIAKIRDDFIVLKTYLIIAYTMIMFPLFIILWNRVFVGKKVSCIYDDFLKQRTVCNRNENLAYIATILATVIGISATAYVFHCIGMIPILHMNMSTNEMAALRININRGFTGNVYIKNLVMILLTPLLSYFTYIYFRVTHKKKWGFIFIINLFLSIIIKTYDFQKSPIIYYFFNYYMIEVMLGNKNILKIFCLIGSLGAVLIYVQYTFVAGYEGKLFTIRSGPGGRIFMTQIATLFLHVQAFPKEVPYLNGASLPTKLARLIGSSNSWVRSGREVMKLYNPSGIKAGTAGVMNTLFVGEAYANWGIWGLMVAPFIVAVTFSLSFLTILKFKKTPLTLVLYLALFQSFTGGLQGGFVDFLYNAGVFLIIGIAYSFYILLNRGKIGMKRPLKLRRRNL